MGLAVLLMITPLTVSLPGLSGSNVFAENTRRSSALPGGSIRGSVSITHNRSGNMAMALRFFLQGRRSSPAGGLFTGAWCGSKISLDITDQALDAGVAIIRLQADGTRGDLVERLGDRGGHFARAGRPPGKDAREYPDERRALHRQRSREQ